jgi:hypothetical protein
MNILLGPTKLPDRRPYFATRYYNARLPRCIVILLRHSLAQKNFQAWDGSRMRRVPPRVNCFAAATLFVA